MKLPDVPLTTPEMRQFLLAVKQVVEAQGVTIESTQTAIDQGSDTDDGLPPEAPTGLNAYSALGGIGLTWQNPDDFDLATVEVWENTSDDMPDPDVDYQLMIAVVPVQPGGVGNYTRTGLDVGATRWYWVRARDKFGNVSDFNSEAGTPITVVTVAPGDLGTTVGYAAPTGLNVTSGLATNSDGLQIVMLNISWNPVVDATGSFYEVGIVEDGSSEIVFPTSSTYMSLQVVGSTDYDVRLRGVDRNGNRTEWGTTVSHTSATTTTSVGQVINAGSTLIDPGKILISGATTLQSWRDGGDNTKIAGGQLATNSVTANKVSVGVRGLDIAGLPFEPNSASQGSGVITSNAVAWGAGTINYIGDSGSHTNSAITAGTVTYTGSPLLIYWTKGATTLTATTSTATAYSANNVVMAIYYGGSNLNVTYGRTIIDGNSIQTGSVNANRITAGTITTNLMSANSINGDRITAGTLDAAKITAGSITTDRMTAGSINGDRITANTLNADKIVTNTITAAKIIGGEITSTTWSEQAYGGALSIGTFVTVFTMNHTTQFTGASHNILLNCQCTKSGSDDAGVSVRIYRNATLIAERSFMLRLSFQFTGSFSVFDQPSAGVNTYSIQLALTTGSAGTTTSTSSNMIVTELKR